MGRFLASNRSQHLIIALASLTFLFFGGLDIFTTNLHNLQLKTLTAEVFRSSEITPPSPARLTYLANNKLSEDRQGWMYASVGTIEQAVEHWDTTQTYPNAMYWGSISSYLNHNSQSIEWYKQASTLTELGDPYFHLGKQYESLDKLSLAADAYSQMLNKQLVTIRPSLAFFSAGRAFQKIVPADHQAATIYLQTAIASDSFATQNEKARAQFFLAESLREIEQIDDALLSYQATTRLWPDHYWSHARMGEIYWQQYNNIELALTSLEQAVEIDPTILFAPNLINKITSSEINE